MSCLARVVFALLLAPMLAGCLGGSPPGPDLADLPPLGLGLEIPEELPGLAPFLEDPTDLARHEVFLREEGARMLEECGYSKAFPSVERALEREDYAEALDTLRTGCSRPFQDQTASYARTAIREGREAEVRDQLHQEALEAGAAALEALQAHPGPSNAVEAQLLHSLYGRRLLTLGAIHGAVRYWGPYEDGSTRNQYQLENAYLGLLGARAASEWILRIMERYPWQEAPCTAPDWDTLLARVTAKFEHAHALVAAHAGPDDINTSASWQSRLEGWSTRRFEDARDNGWWVGLLASEVGAERHIAYWENRTEAAAWPTMDEARYMLALYRNHTRTIFTESNIDQYIFYLYDDRIQYLYDWHTDPHIGAPSFMAHLATRWPYADLECPGTA